MSLMVSLIAAEMVNGSVVSTGAFLKPSVTMGVALAFVVQHVELVWPFCCLQHAPMCFGVVPSFLPLSEGSAPVFV